MPCLMVNVGPQQLKPRVAKKARAAGPDRKALMKSSSNLLDASEIYCEPQ